MIIKSLSQCSAFTTIYGLLAGLAFSVILSTGILPANAAGNSPENVPDFTLMDTDNQPVALESLRGNVVLINFWATWCPPCVEELPSINALGKSFAEKPFKILAINMGEDKETITSFLNRIGFELNFPLLIDPGAKTADLYAVKTLPATLLVNQDGTFAFGGVGAREWNSEQTRNEILPLFD